MNWTALSFTSFLTLLYVHKQEVKEKTYRSWNVYKSAFYEWSVALRSSTHIYIDFQQHMTFEADTHFDICQFNDISASINFSYTTHKHFW